ncbi:MAG: hypothetical protein ACFE9Q_09120 [Candidatus Hodarchaeota archaeon]
MEPSTSEITRNGIMCPKCRLKASSTDTQFCPNCGHNFDYD